MPSCHQWISSGFISRIRKMHLNLFQVLAFRASFLCDSSFPFFLRFQTFLKRSFNVHQFVSFFFVSLLKLFSFLFFLIFHGSYFSGSVETSESFLCRCIRWDFFSSEKLRLTFSETDLILKLMFSSANRCFCCKQKEQKKLKEKWNKRHAATGFRCIIISSRKIISIFQNSTVFFFN